MFFFACSLEDDAIIELHNRAHAARIPVTGLSLDRTDLTLNPGKSATLIVTVQPADAWIKDVTWYSSDTGIAAVDSNGKVTGVTAGIATITVTAQDGGFMASCDVTVANAGIIIGDTSVKLYLNNGNTVLTEGGSTTISAAETGTYTVSIDQGNYSEILWYVNGTVLSQYSSSLSIVLTKRIPGTYQVTVEVIAAGERNTGSHSFVVE